MVQPYPGDLKQCLIMNLACIGLVSQYVHIIQTRLQFTCTIAGHCCTTGLETKSKLLRTNRHLQISTLMWYWNWNLEIRNCSIPKWWLCPTLLALAMHASQSHSVSLVLVHMLYMTEQLQPTINQHYFITSNLWSP